MEIKGTKEDVFKKLLSIRNTIEEDRYKEYFNVKTIHNAYVTAMFIGIRILCEDDKDDSYKDATDERWAPALSWRWPMVADIAEHVERLYPEKALAYFQNIPTVGLLSTLFTEFSFEVFSIRELDALADADEEYRTGYMNLLKECLALTDDAFEIYKEIILKAA